MSDLVRVSPDLAAQAIDAHRLGNVPEAPFAAIFKGVWGRPADLFEQ